MNIHYKRAIIHSYVSLPEGNPTNTNIGDHPPIILWILWDSFGSQLHHIDNSSNAVLHQTQTTGARYHRLILV